MIHSRARGFSLTDLMILLVLGMLTFGTLVPAMQHARSTSNLLKCASNLKQIGQGLMLYANENNGDYPRTRWDPNNPRPTEYTNPMASNPFFADGPAHNDVTAAMFLLLRTQDLTASVFICPSDTATAWTYDGGNVQARSNFPSGEYLSYSMQNCYPDQAAIKDGFHWTSTHSLPSNFAVAADMNPGTQDVLSVNLTSSAEQMQKANSFNHGQRGQEVLYGDGHVEFQQTPFCGVQQDNIYGVGRKTGGTIDPRAVMLAGPPGHKDDSVLLPTAKGKTLPAALPLLVEGVRWYTFPAVLAFAGVVASFVLAMRQRPMSKAG